MSNFIIARELNKIAKQLSAGVEDNYRDDYKLDELENMIEKELGAGLKFTYSLKGHTLSFNTNDFSNKIGVAKSFIANMFIRGLIEFDLDKVGKTWADVYIKYNYVVGTNNSHAFMGLTFDGKSWSKR